MAVWRGGGRTASVGSGGVRMAARAIIIHFASRYLYGDWTPALMAYSAAAATLAPSDAAQIWVTGDNFAMVHRIVEAHRRHADPLFRGDSVEDQLQFGTPRRSSARRAKRTEVLTNQKGVLSGIGIGGQAVRTDSVYVELSGATAPVLRTGQDAHCPGFVDRNRCGLGPMQGRSVQTRRPRRRRSQTVVGLSCRPCECGPSPSARWCSVPTLVTPPDVSSGAPPRNASTGSGRDGGTWRPVGAPTRTQSSRRPRQPV